jgi:hypothetical protein
MSDQTSVDNVFRFIRFGTPAQPVVPAHLLHTQFYQTLAPASNAERVRIATAMLRGTSNEVVRRFEDLTFGNAIRSALSSVFAASRAPTLGMLAALLPADTVTSAGFATDLKKLSDTLMFWWFVPAFAPPQLAEYRELYLAYLALSALGSDPRLGSVSLRRIIKQPLRPDFVPAATKAKIRSVGVADLMVVRQHIKRYEPCEIAHIENVMPGETRSREQRQLERFEEVVTTERESSTEREEELTSTERFELEREASRTIKEDQKFSFDLNVSGQYGPFVEFDTGFGLEIARSEENQTRDATTYARDVVQRSLERVKERVREERIRRITRELEESNLHSFVNETAQGVSGVYQFVDKVYEAQVFNYGKRQMFDLMIPEPASYLAYLEKTADATSAELPPAPDPLQVEALGLLFEDADRTRANHYARLATKYGATGIEPPPPRFRRSSLRHVAPSGTGTSGGASESGGVLAPPVVLEVAIPGGYRPSAASVHTTAMTDNVDHLRVAFATASTRIVQQLDTSSSRDHVGGNPTEGQLYIVRGFNEFTFSETPAREASFETDAKFQLSVFAYETANHSLVCEVEFERVGQTLDAWKLATHEKIRAAYQNRVLEYKDEVSRIKAVIASTQAEERVLGAPPSERRQTVLTELKKHCIAILRQQWFDDGNGMVDGAGPPTFNFDTARQRGSLVRFLEHAFQWDQMQYAFYPYFWARSREWEAQFRKEDPDYEFRQFLRAGSARVAFAIRPGFELAVNHFLETGEVWEGTGEPSVDDPLYRSIVDEIRERADTGDEAIAVGDAWEVRLPTSLLLLRPESARPLLPEWSRVADEAWQWRPAPADAG